MATFIVSVPVKTWFNYTVEAETEEDARQITEEIYLAGETDAEVEYDFENPYGVSDYYVHKL